MEQGCSYFGITMYRIEITYCKNTNATRLQFCCVDSIEDAKPYVVKMVQDHVRLTGIVLVYLYSTVYAAMHGDKVVATVEINDYECIRQHDRAIHRKSWTVG